MTESLGQVLADRRYAAARKKTAKLTPSQIDDRLNVMECAHALRDEIVERLARLEAVEDALRDCIALAASHMGSYMVSHDLKDYDPTHKEIVNRAQRLLGGRELP